MFQRLRSLVFCGCDFLSFCGKSLLREIGRDEKVDGPKVFGIGFAALNIVFKMEFCIAKLYGIC